LNLLLAYSTDRRFLVKLEKVVEVMSGWLKLFILVVSISALNAQASKWSEDQIRATGKNMVSMSGFYNMCVKKKLVKSNPKAIRLAAFMGSKYLVVAGIVDQQEAWLKKGMQGTLVSDPNVSEEVIVVPFSAKSCNYVKSVLDAQYWNSQTFLDIA
jgi:hypothetical protein